MLRNLNAIQVERVLREEQSGPPFPPAADRDAWEAVRAGLGEAECARVISQGEAAARAGIPAMPATLFLKLYARGRAECLSCVLGSTTQPARMDDLGRVPGV